MKPRTRLAALTAALAMIASGCGLTDSPVYSSPDEVLDAVLAVRDGARIRATAELTVDEGEVRGALRDDDAALELFRDAVDSGEVEDVDGLLAELEELQAVLADHAVLLDTGADGSARLAAEFRGDVWADLRVGSDLEPGDDPAAGFRIDLQTQVDWDVAAELFEQPDLGAQLDDVAASIAPFVDGAPELAPIGELVTAFLAGELVGIGGDVDQELLDGIGGQLPGIGSDPTDPGALFGFDTDLLDPRAFAESAFTFDGFRTEGGRTLVDVTIEVRTAAETFLDAAADAPDGFGMSFEEVEDARAELDRLPDRFVDVATLAFDDQGVLLELRVDLLDIALQTARATEPDDEELAIVERLAGELDATGLFAVFAVDQVGAVDSVLGDPGTSITLQQLADAVSTFFLGAFGGDVGETMALEGFEELEADAFEGFEPAAPTLSPAAVGPGACFDDDVLYGYAPDGAPTTVDCAGPHDNEAFAAVSFGADLGGQDMQRASQDALSDCFDAFERFVGTPYFESVLLLDLLAPTADEYAAGATEAVCYVYDFEPVTGSLAGAAR